MFSIGLLLIFVGWALCTITEDWWTYSLDIKASKIKYFIHKNIGPPMILIGVVQILMSLMILTWKYLP